MKNKAISVENVSKVYRLGEINRAQFFGDLRRWAGHKLRRGQAFGDPAAEAEEQPQARDLFYALQDISFEVKEGEALGVIGVNGAGKSTLLKLISRITLPSSGRIRTNGRVGSLLEVGTGFHPDLTGRDNVYMNGAILGMSRKEVDAKFDEIVDFSGVEKFIDTPVKRYSSGMYVRLAFSVAACLEPEVLIVDEILAVGDVAFRRKCFDRIQGLLGKGVTLLFVAHDMGSVTQFCANAIWLDAGRVRECGTSSTVVESYRKEAQLKSGSAERSNEVRRKNAAGPFDDFSGCARQGDRSLSVQELRILDRDGRPVRSVSTGEAFSIELDYMNEQSHSEQALGSIAISIHDEQARPIARLDSLWQAMKFKVAEKRGTLRCVFAKNPFMTGIYGISLNIKVNGKTSDRILFAGNFEVSDGDFYGKGVIAERQIIPVCFDHCWSHVEV